MLMKMFFMGQILLIGKITKLKELQLIFLRNNYENKKFRKYDKGVVCW